MCVCVCVFAESLRQGFGINRPWISNTVSDQSNAGHRSMDYLVECLALITVARAMAMTS